MHKILMVEDDAAIRGALGRHLSRWGYQVQAAENFQNILEQFEEFQPHLVLLDISLPFFDGYYWCRQIRRASQTPIIFLSSAGDDMNLVMAIQLGADDFIPKPFRIEVVLAKIQALLRRTYSFGARQKQVMETHRKEKRNPDQKKNADGRKSERIAQRQPERAGIPKIPVVGKPQKAPAFGGHGVIDAQGQRAEKYK